MDFLSRAGIAYARILGQHDSNKKDIITDSGRPGRGPQKLVRNTKAWGDILSGTFLLNGSAR